MDVFITVLVIMAVVATYARYQEAQIRKYERDDCND